MSEDNKKKKTKTMEVILWYSIKRYIKKPKKYDNNLNGN